MLDDPEEVLAKMKVMRTSLEINGLQYHPKVLKITQKLKYEAQSTSGYKNNDNAPLGAARYSNKMEGFNQSQQESEIQLREILRKYLNNVKSCVLILNARTERSSG